MIAQPRGERLRRAIREEVDRAVLLQIDNDRGVDATCAEGEIVNADDPGGRPGRRLAGRQDAEEGSATHRHASLAVSRAPASPPRAKAITRSSSRKRMVVRAEGAASSGTRSVKICRGGAEKLPDLQHSTYGCATPG